MTMNSKKRHGKAFGIVVGAILAATAIAEFVTAQPSGPVGIPRVQTTARFTGAGLSTNRLELNIAGAACGAGSAVASLNALGSGTCVAVGTVTSVAGGSGLTSTGTTAVTLDVGSGSNITVAADSVSVVDAFDQSASGKSTKVGDLRGNTITPTLSADRNNWAPSLFSSATILEVTVTGSTRTVTGLTAGTAGRWITIRNVNAEGGVAMVFTHNDGASSSGNRFSTPGAANFTLQGADTIDLYYDGAAWIIRKSRAFYDVVATHNITADNQMVISGAATLGSLNTSTVVASGNVTVGAGAQVISGGTPSANHGSLSTGSTNFSGDVTSIGSFTSVVLTYSAAFANRSRCIAQPQNASVVLETMTVTTTASAATFSCFNTLSQVAANCDDFTYICTGQ